jgi:hypothetical protein
VIFPLLIISLKITGLPGVVKGARLQKVTAAAVGGILKTGRKGLIIIGSCLIGVGTEKRGLSVERSGTGKIEKDTPPRAVPQASAPRIVRARRRVLLKPLCFFPSCPFKKPDIGIPPAAVVF